MWGPVELLFRDNIRQGVCWQSVPLRIHTFGASPLFITRTRQPQKQILLPSLPKSKYFCLLCRAASLLSAFEAVAVRKRSGGQRQQQS